MENKVLARVNGKEITAQDLDFFFRTLGPQVQGQFEGPEGQAKLLDELVYQELFYSDAIDTKLDESEMFIKEMAKAKESILKQVGIQNLLMSITVDDAAVKAYYDQNIEMFASQQSAQASHILVSEEEEAKKVLAEINEGLDFAEAATKYSSCPSKENGGDLGEFQKGQMVPEFEEACFTMEIGSISEPVKTQFGYHIIKLVSKSDAGTQEFAMVANQITQQLTIEKQNKAYLAKVEELKAKYEIEML